MANAPLSVDLRPPKRGGVPRIVPKHLVTLRRILRRIHELEALERALALASKFFIALIPAALLAMSLLPHRSSFADSIVLRLGLTGEGARAVRQLFASPAQVRGAMSALGILILAYAILSMAQALQRVYEDAWRLPRLHARGTARALIWMLTALLYFAAISPIRATLAGAGPTAVRVYAPILLGSVVWAITPHILLARRVPARRLLPTGILTAVAITVFSIVSRVYMPAIMTTDTHRYGLVGATFGIVSWLYAAATVMIVCACIGAVLAEPNSDSRPRTPSAG